MMISFHQSSEAMHSSFFKFAEVLYWMCDSLMPGRVVVNAVASEQEEAWFQAGVCTFSL